MELFGSVKTSCKCWLKVDAFAASYLTGAVFLIITYCFAQVVHSKFQDLVPKRIELDDPQLQRPDEDKIKEVIK